MPTDFHRQILDIPAKTSWVGDYLRVYKEGHRDALRDAAEVGYEADDRIATLESALRVFIQCADDGRQITKEDVRRARFALSGVKANG